MMFTETIAEFLIQHFGRIFYLGFVALLLLGVPAAIISAGLTSLIRGTGRLGLILGFAVGIWASLCALCVPYLGMYPNLPAVAMLFLAGISGGTWVAEVCIHLSNMALWPLSGWLIFRLLRPVPREHAFDAP